MYRTEQQLSKAPLVQGCGAQKYMYRIGNYLFIKHKYWQDTVTTRNAMVSGERWA
jgi:hypothetical protein